MLTTSLACTGPTAAPVDSGGGADAGRDGGRADAALVVDVSAPVGEADGRMVGFLHVLPRDRDRLTANLVPLRARLLRGREDDLRALAPGLEANGTAARSEVVLGDAWEYTAPWPGDDDNWTPWKTFVVLILSRPQRTSPTWLSTYGTSPTAST